MADQPPAANDCGLLYHLIQVSLWQQHTASKTPYYPPTYEADGFIHLTKEANLLLPVANHFYRSVEGSFVVLELDSRKLTSRVVFEPAAPVGTTPAHKVGAEEAEQPLFPHLYGTIDFDAVVRELEVERDASGAFLAIKGLPA